MSPVLVLRLKSAHWKRVRSLIRMFSACRVLSVSGNTNCQSPVTSESRCCVPAAPDRVRVPCVILTMRFPSMILAAVCLVHAHPSDSDFVQRILMNDGQVVLRARVHNKTAMRTSYSGYDLLELTDQNELIRLWSRGSQLLDCGVETDAEAISNFLHEFDHSDPSQSDECAKSRNMSCSALSTSQKVTKVMEDEDELPGEVVSMMRNQILVEKCTQFQHRRHSGNRRVKRGLLFPGTNFCGAGSSVVTAEKSSGRRATNEVLGLHVSADRCCQEHDSCRHYISPFSWKYQLFNYRIHTVSHCRCDERFRRCLKLANTPTANMIGKLFFNIGKTKCFRFKREKACKKRSWWGTCLRKGKVRRAYFKNSSPFESSRMRGVSS